MSDFALTLYLTICPTVFLTVALKAIVPTLFPAMLETCFGPFPLPRFASVLDFVQQTPANAASRAVSQPLADS